VKGKSLEVIDLISELPLATLAELEEHSPTVFLDLLSGHWDVTVKILHRFAAIVRYCDDRIMDLSTLRAEKRICAELLRLAKPDAKNPGGWLIYPMWTQKEIAGRVGSTRETVGRVLVQLADLEIVRRQSKALFVLDQHLVRCCTRPLRCSPFRICRS